MVSPHSASAQAWWSVPSSAGAIEGYLTTVSAVPGQIVDVRVNVPSTDTYRLRVFRLNGSADGGVEVGCNPTCGVNRQGIAQPTEITDPLTNEIRAPWTTTDSLRVGARWASGYYIVQFVLTSGVHAGTGAFAPLVVLHKPGTKRAPMLVQIPVSTAAAYNTWGGLSAYSGGPWSEVVSLDRPFATGLLGGEYGFLRFLAKRGLAADFQTDLDTSRNPSSLLKYRLVAVAGHDEYWTQRTADAFYSAKAHGVNLAFFGANIGYWRTRLERGGRSIAIYKHGWRDPLGVAGLFREVYPECHLVGIQHQGGLLNWSEGDYTVAPGALSSPWFAGTGFRVGDTLPGLVSVEVDTVPHSFAVVGKTCPGRRVITLFSDNRGGDTFGDAKAVTYTARSGAQIFSAGSLDFVGGLDDMGGRIPGGTSREDPRLERFVLNMLKELTGP